MINDPRIKSWSFKKTQDPAVLLTTALVILMAVVAVRNTHWLTLLLFAGVLVIWGIVLYFFRDPDRDVLNQPGLVVGPADGVVVSIQKLLR